MTRIDRPFATESSKHDQVESHPVVFSNRFGDPFVEFQIVVRQDHRDLFDGRSPKTRLFDELPLFRFQHGVTFNPKLFLDSNFVLGLKKLKKSFSHFGDSPDYL